MDGLPRVYALGFILIFVVALLALPVIATSECALEDNSCRISVLEERVAELESQQTQIESWQEIIEDFVTLVCNVLALECPDFSEPAITCNTDNDCTIGGMGLFCRNGDVWLSQQTPVCLNPGTEQSICSTRAQEQFRESCTFGCNNGTCLDSPSGNVIFRTNVFGGDYYDCTLRSNCWIAMDQGDVVLQSFGFNGKSRECRDGTVLLSTPEGFDVVDYGSSTQVAICDDEGRESRFSVGRIPLNPELSTSPTEPFASNDQEVYNAEWKTVAPFPLSVGGIFAEAINGKIYAGQGAPPPGQGDFFMYDPVQDTWTQRSTTSEIYNRASAVVNGKIYAFGGVENGGPLSKAHEYDPATDSWTALPNVPTARIAPGAAVVSGKIYVFGGSPSFGANAGTAANEMYDPSTNSWQIKSPMPTSRIAPQVAAHNNKIYVFGGHQYVGGVFTVLSVVEVYDTLTDTWAALSDPMSNERTAGRTFTHKGKIYLVGGVLNNGLVAAIDIFDPATNSWGVFEYLPTPRSDLGVTVNNNILYTIAGSGPGINMVETYPLP